MTVARAPQVLIAGLCLAFLGCQTEQTQPEPSEPASQLSTMAAVASTKIIEEHWDDGSLRVRREVLPQADGTVIDHGAYACWYKGGKQQEYAATYIEGKLDGVEQRWHANGTLATEQHWKTGIRHGTRRDWDPQGRLRKEEVYEDGKSHGTWTIWKDNGDIKWRQKFDHGTPLSE